MNYNSIIEKLNETILSAIEYGGDLGGPYFSTSFPLIEGMNSLLKLMDIEEFYEVQFIRIPIYCHEVPQFVRKGE